MTAADRLDEIAARADAANYGPWEPDGSHFWTPSGRSDFHLDPADAEFIAHARTDVPRLVAALRAVDEVSRLHRSRLPKASRCNCLACQSWRAVEAALGEVAS